MEHGGARPGAGRKRLDHEVLYVRIKAEDKEFITSLADEMGVKVGDIIHQLIEAFKEASNEKGRP